MDKTRQPFHLVVATTLIAQLRQGTAPWQKPWDPGPPHQALPMNPLTGKRYRGINALHLLSQGHTDPRWMTYRQAVSIGAHVRRGEHGTLIQYWKLTEEQPRTDGLGRPVLDAHGLPVKVESQLERPRVFLATVFNASQIDGLLPLPSRPDPGWQALERPEQILQACGATLRHDARSAPHYLPATDTIVLPDKAQFPSAAQYYAAALHELGHWSGHPTRLNRDLAHPFGSEGYAREELRAEIASLMLGDALGIGHDPGQHAAYVGSWLRALQRDPLEIFRAAADAEKIHTFVLGLAPSLQLQQGSVPVPLPQRAQAFPMQPLVVEAAMHTHDPSPPIPSAHDASGAVLPGQPGNAAMALAATNPMRSEDLPAPRHLPVNGDSRAGAATRQAPAGAAEGSESVVPSRVFLAVPYRQHAKARAFGARWDRTAHSWYVPAGIDLTPFARWMPGAARVADACGTVAPAPRPVEPGIPESGRTYLAVPYAERHAARAAGAAWDAVYKAWYAGAGADMAQLARWRPDNAAQQVPAIQPREEFAAAMRRHGLLAAGAHPIMDGRKHRVPVQGGKRGALDGFYVAHLDGHPAGRIINYKTGADATWHSKGYVLRREQTAAIVAQARVNVAAREAEQARVQEQTAQRLGRLVAELVAPQQPTPYLQRKGIVPQAGVLTDRDGRITVVPGIDADGKVWTLQTIQEDGTKRFVKDSRKEGCFHVIGGLPALSHVPALVISEGYATAASVSQALGFATVAAFDAGNLLPVARALQARFPDKAVIIAGDDDRHLVLTHGENRGRAKAQEAATATGGHLLLPVFAPGESRYPPGLAPVTPERYREHCARGAALSATQLAALEQMKRHTDFNDLAVQSVLGPDAIGRQVRAFVDAVVRARSAGIAQHGMAYGRTQAMRESGGSMAH